MQSRPTAPLRLVHRAAGQSAQAQAQAQATRQAIPICGVWARQTRGRTEADEPFLVNDSDRPDSSLARRPADSRSGSASAAPTVPGACLPWPRPPMPLMSMLASGGAGKQRMQHAA